MEVRCLLIFFHTVTWLQSKSWNLLKNIWNTACIKPTCTLYMYVMSPVGISLLPIRDVSKVRERNIMV